MRLLATSARLTVGCTDAPAAQLSALDSVDVALFTPVCLATAGGCGAAELRVRIASGGGAAAVRCEPFGGAALVGGDDRSNASVELALSAHEPALDVTVPTAWTPMGGCRLAPASAGAPYDIFVSPARQAAAPGAPVEWCLAAGRRQWYHHLVPWSPAPWTQWQMQAWNGWSAAQNGWPVACTLLALSVLACTHRHEGRKLAALACALLVADAVAVAAGLAWAVWAAGFGAAALWPLGCRVIAPALLAWRVVLYSGEWPLQALALGLAAFALRAGYMVAAPLLLCEACDQASKGPGARAVRR